MSLAGRRCAINAARRPLVFAAALGLGLMMTVASLADGGPADTPTCPRGEVYDPGRMKCVKQQAGTLPDKALAAYAYALSKAGRDDEALEVLDLLANPDTAEALNYRGYATRKLGRIDEGIAYYLKSLALAPNYAQVREYLGEAYVQKGDIASAKAQLRAIESICGTGCEEYRDLAKAIAESSRS